MKYLVLPHGINPEIGTPNSAGIDFFVPTDFRDTLLEPMGNVIIPTRVKVIIPEGFSGIFYNRSSVGSKGVILGAKVVDSDYRGEVFINLINISDKGFLISPRMKIAQMVVSKCRTDLERIELTEYEKYSTIRNNGALGSTNKGDL